MRQNLAQAQVLRPRVAAGLRALLCGCVISGTGTSAYGCPKNALYEEIDERIMLVAAAVVRHRGVDNEIEAERGACGRRVCSGPWCRSHEGERDL